MIWRELGADNQWREVSRETGEVDLQYGQHGDWSGVKIFVSPTGNGFMVFNPDHQSLVRFFDTKGKLVAKFARTDLLTEEERNWSGDYCVCTREIPRFGAMPKYVGDGSEAEFAADKTGRKIRFSLANGKRVEKCE